jgi:pimeloyl-ACP methyl ester carboxylesterase
MEVKIGNNSISLAGTITMPEGAGPFPAIVLISGSGPQDRNEEIFEHKPFWIIADYLSRNGYAVLRFDDRGTAKSSGDYKTATLEDFAGDAFAAFEFMKKYPGVDPLKTGLMGHSEGGMIAPLLASRHSDIAFIIMMAGPGVRGDELLLLQSELIYKSKKIPPAVIKSDQEIKKKAFAVIFSEKDTAKIRIKIKKIYSAANESELLKLGISKNQIDPVVQQYIAPEMLSIIRFDPCPVLKKVKCPVLALNGDKDMQVPSKQNLKAIQTCFAEGGNTNAVTKELWYLNHLFQSATTGSISEYIEIEETVSPVALEAMSEWLNNVVKNK